MSLKGFAILLSSLAMTSCILGDPYEADFKRMKEAKLDTLENRWCVRNILPLFLKDGIEAYAKNDMDAVANISRVRDIQIPEVARLRRYRNTIEWAGTEYKLELSPSTKTDKNGYLSEDATVRNPYIFGIRLRDITYTTLKDDNFMLFFRGEFADERCTIALKPAYQQRSRRPD